MKKQPAWRIKARGLTGMNKDGQKCVGASPTGSPKDLFRCLAEGEK
jgi:hypothetical protein